MLLNRTKDRKIIVCTNSTQAPPVRRAGHAAELSQTDRDRFDRLGAAAGT